MVARAAEPASPVADAASAAPASGTPARATPNSVEQPLMADDKVTVFILHRAMTVSGAVTTTKGAGRPDQPYLFKDSRAEFVVRDASDDEAKSSARQLRDDVDRRVEELQLKAAVDRRVEELRLEAAVDRRVEELRRQAGRVDG